MASMEYQGEESNLGVANAFTTLKKLTRKPILSLTGRNVAPSYILLCIKGRYTGQFFHLSSSEKTNIIGSDCMSEEVTLPVQDASMDGKHALFQFRHPLSPSSPLHTEFRLPSFLPSTHSHPSVFQPSTSGYFSIQDLNSKRGTWVQLRHYRARPISPPQDVQMHSTLLSIVFGDPLEGRIAFKEFLYVHDLEHLYARFLVILRIHSHIHNPLVIETLYELYSQPEGEAFLTMAIPLQTNDRLRLMDAMKAIHEFIPSREKSRPLILRYHTSRYILATIRWAGACLLSRSGHAATFLQTLQPTLPAHDRGLPNETHHPSSLYKSSISLITEKHTLLRRATVPTPSSFQAAIGALTSTSRDVFPFSMIPSITRSPSLPSAYKVLTDASAKLSTSPPVNRSPLRKWFPSFFSRGSSSTSSTNPPFLFLSKAMMAGSMPSESLVTRRSASYPRSSSPYLNAFPRQSIHPQIYNPSYTHMVESIPSMRERVSPLTEMNHPFLHTDNPLNPRIEKDGLTQCSSPSTLDDSHTTESFQKDVYESTVMGRNNRLSKKNAPYEPNQRGLQPLDDIPPHAVKYEDISKSIFSIVEAAHENSPSSRGISPSPHISLATTPTFPVLSETFSDCVAGPTSRVMQPQDVSAIASSRVSPVMDYTQHEVINKRKRVFKSPMNDDIHLQANRLCTNRRTCRNTASSSSLKPHVDPFESGIDTQSSMHKEEIRFAEAITESSLLGSHCDPLAQEDSIDVSASPVSLNESESLIFLDSAVYDFHSLESPTSSRTYNENPCALTEKKELNFAETYRLTLPPTLSVSPKLKRASTSLGSFFYDENVEAKVLEKKRLDDGDNSIKSISPACTHEMISPFQEHSGNIPTLVHTAAIVTTQKSSAKAFSRATSEGSLPTYASLCCLPKETSTSIGNLSHDNAVSFEPTLIFNPQRTAHLGDATQSSLAWRRPRTEGVPYQKGKHRTIRLPEFCKENILCRYVNGRYEMHLLEPDRDEDGNCWIRLLANTTYKLHPDDTIRMGLSEFRVHRFHTGISKNQGHRPTMEDEDTIIHDLAISNDLPCSFFGVYDGHGGGECAAFVKNALHHTFRKKLLEFSKGFDLNAASVLHDHVSRALTSSFLAVDKQFFDLQDTVGGNTGCTAVVVAIVGTTIWCANCGDARAVLCRKGVAVPLSIDHKPDREIELRRIMAAGGYIKARRILGRLAVSRAFGDFEFKTGKSTRNMASLVIVNPEVRYARLTPDAEFLILACDGLFDVFTSQTAVDFVRNRLKEMKGYAQDPQRVAADLVEEAILRRNSRDNVSVVIVTFHPQIR
ncbi:protein phosphatase 2C domain-containing protein [Cardiosporidium cionae]|uniref:Protein phosphatase 2C domain-containing protein n=1 Tax=Cardiosporidium cionae TaxID=476202 RepID=A0ABQ7J545_9APIC|nr:protein phosphatase 2C domain-containing protein [Cardiosporidium cionae]|eukprot:KAF8819146.1 protein phosphatase 2C domain-containing protein [Cardiosporidium cionae]